MFLAMFTVYLMLTMMTHTTFFFSPSSSVELTLTSLAYGSLAGSFKTVIIVYWYITEVYCLLVT